MRTPTARSIASGLCVFLILLALFNRNQVKHGFVLAMIDYGPESFRAEAMAAVAEDSTFHRLLLEALEHKDIWVKIDAMRAIGSIENEGAFAIPYVLRLLDDSDWQVRKTAVRTIGEIGITSPEIEANLIDRANKKLIDHCYVIDGLELLKSSSANVEAYIKTQKASSDRFTRDRANLYIKRMTGPAESAR